MEAGFNLPAAGCNNNNCAPGKKSYITLELEWLAFGNGSPKTRIWSQRRSACQPCETSRIRISRRNAIMLLPFAEMCETVVGCRTWKHQLCDGWDLLEEVVIVS